MTNPATATGPLQLDGVFNFRDLGGLVAADDTTTASGVVFRCDGLHRSPLEQRGRLAEVGLRHVVDLRTPEELDREGHFEHDGITFTHVPIIEKLSSFTGPDDNGPDDDLLAGHYHIMATSNGEAFARALDRVATAVGANEPIVFHCTAGKDRTGVLAALILAGAGVADDVIAEDFARSAAAVPLMTAWYREHSGTTPDVRMKEMGFDPSRAEMMMSAESSTMLQFLQRLRADHGTIDGYLAHIGATEAVDHIARRLLS